MSTTPAASVVREGCRDGIALVLAYTPFGLVVGATFAGSGMDRLVAWSSSPLMFGGAAQLVAVQLLDAGVGSVVVVLAALVVNSRMLLYSASLAPHVAGWPARWRWAGAYLLADPVYAVAIGRFGRGDTRGGLAYYLAAGLTLWTGWLTITAAGTLAGGALPVRLELAAPLTFLLLMLPMLTRRAAYAAAAAAAVVATAASALPLGLGLLTGSAAGIAAGALTGARRA